MPTDSPEASGPRKRKLSTKVTTNGDPEVEQKKKKLEAKKKSTKSAPTKKHSLTRAPGNTTTKPPTKPAPAPRPRCPSVEVEEIDSKFGLYKQARLVELACIIWSQGLCIN